MVTMTYQYSDDIALRVGQLLESNESVATAQPSLHEQFIEHAARGSIVAILLLRERYDKYRQPPNRKGSSK